ncbi:MAG: pyrimidine 5'-nucleotidase [Alphaproteobacteria bacterium]|nr:pyrimidine 5'-nucleotidase [Alphaproteobacteria bacterium]
MQATATITHPLAGFTGPVDIVQTPMNNNAHRPTDGHDWRDIDHWIFDLDNTLYHHSYDLFSQVEKLMTLFVMEKLQLPADEARALQKKYFYAHGTTLKGLMDHHQIDPDEYLARVHEIDYNILPRNELLAQQLQQLTGQKYIFTNGNHAHVVATLERLGVPLSLFDGVVDIKKTSYIPKPQRAAYESFFSYHPVKDKRRVVMIDDIADNLKVAKEMGLRTVWLRGDSHPNNPVGGAALHPHLDLAIDHVGQLLMQVLGAGMNNTVIKK